jgi:dolichyl-phosphate-mannose--protein O-mannosyl transferase
MGLILLPFIVYLSFFWVHFTILKQSGTGDVFMSPAFQETLAGNEMLLSSAGKSGPLFELEYILRICRNSLP